VNPLGLRALRHIALCCPSIDEARTFYTEGWGLEAVHDEPGRLCLRGTGTEHHILDFADADERGLRHVAFAVATPRDVDDAAAHIDSLGVDIAVEPHQSDEPGGGYRFGFRDPEGRLIVLSALMEAVAPRDRRAPRPIDLSHVVFNTVDLEGAVEFWTDIVGLRVSDWSEDQMCFLRCNERHHSIAFNRAEWTSVNHVACELPDVDAFLQAIGRLRHQGHVPQWGPGRHGPGNNAFAYFGDPLGYVPELTTGLEVVAESSWVPRVWQRVPEQSDLWGTAGPPSAEARSLMAGTPDPTSPSAASGWAGNR
jgi:catechol 2,3-dioxygenase-like lactoylglutathione lyase family enzyme